MLSDKAKGKQRAINDDDFDAESEQRRPITIRFTEREPDLLLGVSPRDTVRELKALVSHQVFKPSRVHSHLYTARTDSLVAAVA
jgi:hypothetical protein